MERTLAPLPYKNDALEPYVTGLTIEVHYERHHQGYLKKLLELVEGKPERDEPLETLIRSASGEIFENAAQVWNHDFFWKSLKPGGSAPGGELLAAIERDFGSLAELERRFLQAARGHFGSGWLWLVLDFRHRLRVVTTHDADNPLRQGGAPLLAVDLWEHAYYLDYLNERDPYVGERDRASPRLGLCCREPPGRPPARRRGRSRRVGGRFRRARSERAGPEAAGSGVRRDRAGPRSAGPLGSLTTDTATKASSCTHRCSPLAGSASPSGAGDSRGAAARRPRLCARRDPALRQRRARSHAGVPRTHRRRGPLALARGLHDRVGLHREDRRRVPVPFFRSRQVDLSIAWSALFHGALVGEVWFEAPELNFVVGPSPSERQAGTEADWRKPVRDLFPIRIDRVTARGGSVHFRNFRSEPPVDVYLRDVRLVVRNLTNSLDLAGDLVVRGQAAATPMEGGQLEVRFAVDPFAAQPTFDVEAQATGVALVQFNDFFRAYGGFDVERGRLRLYAELAAEGGRFEGYLKPFFEDVDVLQLREEVPEQGWWPSLWEALVGGAAEALAGPGHRSDRDPHPHLRPGRGSGGRLLADPRERAPQRVLRGLRPRPRAQRRPSGALTAALARYPLLGRSGEGNQNDSFSREGEGTPGQAPLARGIDRRSPSGRSRDLRSALRSLVLRRLQRRPAQDRGSGAGSEADRIAAAAYPRGPAREGAPLGADSGARPATFGAVARRGARFLVAAIAHERAPLGLLAPAQQPLDELMGGRVEGEPPVVGAEQHEVVTARAPGQLGVARRHDEVARPCHRVDRRTARERLRMERAQELRFGKHLFEEPLKPRSTRAPRRANGLPRWGVPSVITERTRRPRSRDLSSSVATRPPMEWPTSSTASRGPCSARRRSAEFARSAQPDAARSGTSQIEESAAPQAASAPPGARGGHPGRRQGAARPA